MTTGQTNLYFYHWGKVREHFLGKGIDPKQVDAKRHELHVEALGARKSSKDFTNADLDKVIATFRAIYDDANFDAQMKQQEQPEERRHRLLKRAYGAMRTFLTPDREGDQAFFRAADGYLKATALRMFHRPPDVLPENQLAEVMGALERTARVRKAQREARERETASIAKGNPF